jgi:hypothetical protein
MALDKAIKSGKEHRKPYRRYCEQIDPSCRNHGGCPFCEGNRLYQYHKELQKSLDKMKEWRYN